MYRSPLAQMEVTADPRGHADWRAHGAFRPGVCLDRGAALPQIPSLRLPARKVWDCDWLECVCAGVLAGTRNNVQTHARLLLFGVGFVWIEERG